MINLNGKMVERLHADMARRTLKIAQATAKPAGRVSLPALGRLAFGVRVGPREREAERMRVFDLGTAFAGIARPLSQGPRLGYNAQRPGVDE